MARTDYTLIAKINDLWRAAKPGRPIILDFSNLKHGQIKSYNFERALYNARWRVCKHKNNPLYAELWAKMERTELKRKSPTKLELSYRPYLIERKRKRFYNFSIFPELPSGVSHGKIRKFPYADKWAQLSTESRK